MSYMLGIIVPKDEEKFNRLWKALGVSFWNTYIGMSPLQPIDLRDSGIQYRLMGTLSPMEKDKE